MDDAKKLYEKQAELMKKNPQVRASHILVEKEEDAKALRTRIVKGEDFAKLAKENSKDPGSGSNGGDLGFMQRGQTVPAFDEMLFKLKPGEMSEPVKTEFGYHIIKVEEHRLLPPLSELKDRMALHLIEQARLDGERWLDAWLPSPAPPSGPAPPSPRGARAPRRTPPSRTSWPIASGAPTPEATPLSSGSHDWPVACGAVETRGCRAPGGRRGGLEEGLGAPR